MSDATTVLFGLPGARVERVERRSDGTRVVDVITDEPTAAACPSCGGGLDISEGIRGYLTERSTLWRRPHHGALEQIRWRCREDYCKLGPFTEAITQVPARVRSTLRLRRQMAKAIGDAARSVGRGRPG
ncbi:hypothetical protein [Mycobacterium tuberculosis]|uniref:hypothetical protein n=1 Tax=Mycobacterium tuberculosis TaxID=1773 RepID=UPI0005E06044|nr:hypothetical protein [Mycobacterium tuberculosis]CMS63806.1 transposase%2C degenerate [Mycobacterium tuberculosis]